jgi:MFS family permease
VDGDGGGDGGRPFRLRAVALTAYGPTVVNALGHGAVLPVLALRARELGADLGTAALVVALLGVGQLLTSLPAGALVARVGERRALVGAGLLDALALLAAAVAGSVPALCAAVLVSGSTWSVFLLARQGYVMDAVPTTHRARALSALGGSHRVGVLLGPLAGAGVIALTQLRAVFVLAAVMSLVAAGLALLVPDHGREARAAGEAPLRVLDVLREHRRVLAGLGSAVVVIGAVRSLRTGVLPLWAESVGLGAEQTSLLFAAANALDVLMFYPAGVVMDRVGRTPVAVAVVALISAGVLVLPLTSSFATVLAAASLMAVGNGLGSGIVMTLGADSAPAQGRSQFLGGWRLCGDVGSTGGPLALSGLLVLVPLATACLVTGAAGLAGTGWVAHQVRRLDRARRAAGPRRERT